MNRVIPTVFAYSKKDFDERFLKLIKLSKDLQIDIMDGKFVKEKSIPIKEIPDLRKYKNNFEAHLMIENPSEYIKELKKKGFKKIIFHYEAIRSDEIEKITKKIKKFKMKAFMAVNPETPVSNALPFIHKLDGILFLGVHPGKEHQNFIEGVYSKIEELRGFSKGIKIQVDGGVNFEVAEKLKKICVDLINSGSFVSDAKDPKEIIKRLNRILS